MQIEKNILHFIKSKNKDLEISGLRGLVKTEENEWSFRFTYRKGDYLSVSKLFKVKIEGIKKIPSFVLSKKHSKENKKTIKQK